MQFGAWQRRAVLARVATPALAPRLLGYGFFANADVAEPRLLCKTIDQYEERPEKDYSETIVLMIAVGVAEPLLADPKDIPPEGPPEELLALGPLHCSEDTVLGADECARFFPPGYSEPEHKPKPKSKKKKKKRHETRDENEGESVDAATDAVDYTEASGEGGSADGEVEEEGDAEGDGDGELEEEEEEDTHMDKATSPPPVTS